MNTKQAKIAGVRASRSLEHAHEHNSLKQHLQGYLGLKEGTVERIGLLKAKDVPKKLPSPARGSS